jgi:hypothetical protein
MREIERREKKARKSMNELRLIREKKSTKINE